LIDATLIILGKIICLSVLQTTQSKNYSAGWHRRSNQWSFA